MFKGLMTGVSGIRGVIGEGMTPEVAMLWAGGFGTWLKGGKVVIGRDARSSGEMLSFAVKAGLTAAGCDVDDVGMTATPVCALAVEKRGAAGGIIITASHNPQEWNALKFVRYDGRMLTAQDMIALERIVTDGPLRSVGWNKLGRVLEWEGAEIAYINSVTGLSCLNLNKIRNRKFRVAIDNINSAGSFIYPDLLEALGCQVVPINSDGSGNFVHPPIPTIENIQDLCATVVKHGCAVGFAVDPDGDRLSAVDEKGIPLGEELTLALVVKAVLSRNKGNVVINSLTSQVIEDVAHDAGVECHRTKVGEANVASGMKELNAVIGGEGNGGIMLPELHLVRDAGVGMAIILDYLSGNKKPLSEHREKLPTYTLLKEEFLLGEIDAPDIISFAGRQYEHDQVSTIDGIRVVQSDGWVQVRSSNTEPILRIYAESRDPNRAKALLNEMMGYIQNYKE